MNDIFLYCTDSDRTHRKWVDSKNRATDLDWVDGRSCEYLGRVIRPPTGLLYRFRSYTTFIASDYLV